MLFCVWPPWKPKLLGILSNLREMQRVFWLHSGKADGPEGWQKIERVKSCVIGATFPSELRDDEFCESRNRLGGCWLCILPVCLVSTLAPEQYSTMDSLEP